MFLKRILGQKGRIKSALLILIAFLLISSIRQNVIHQIPVDDFVAYWAAARLQILGLNPYSATEILAVERSAGMQGNEPLIMLNPPWTLALLLPFGFLDYGTGRLAWLILGLSVVLISLRWLWHVYEGPHRSFWVALPVAFCFVPLLVCLVLGQITPLILLGVAGFLYFERRARPLSAGACLVLLGFKPQLFYLFWVALLLWVVLERRWRVLLGAFLGGAMTMALILWDSAILTQYFDLARNQPPMFHWRTPTLGTLLRTLFGMERTWLQFAPMFAGTAWLLLYWQTKRDQWIWSDRLPLLLIVSLTTTSYVWFYDQMLILPALLQVAIAGLDFGRNQQSLMIAAFSVMNLTLAILIFFKFPPLWFVWSFSCWLVLYWHFLLRSRGNSLGQLVHNVRLPLGR